MIFKDVSILKEVSVLQSSYSMGVLSAANSSIQF